MRRLIKNLFLIMLFCVTSTKIFADNFIRQNDILQVDLDSIKVEKYNKNLYPVSSITKSTYKLPSIDNPQATPLQLYTAAIQNSLEQNGCCKSWNKICDNYIKSKEKEAVNGAGHSGIGMLTISPNICRAKYGTQIIEITKSNMLVYNYKNGSFYSVIEAPFLFLDLSTYTLDGKLVVSMNSIRLKSINPKKFKLIDEPIYGQNSRNITKIANKCVTNQSLTLSCKAAIDSEQFYEKYIFPKIDFLVHSTI